jgi:hypothetical protein
VEVAPLTLPRTFGADEHGFPEDLFVFETAEGKHVCVQAETPPPDPMIIEVLAVTLTVQDGEEFLEAMGMAHGELVISIIGVTFEEACKIAYSKPHVQALGLQKGRQSIRLFHIR